MGRWWFPVPLHFSVRPGRVSMTRGRAKHLQHQRGESSRGKAEERDATRRDGTHARTHARTHQERSNGGRQREHVRSVAEKEPLSMPHIFKIMDDSWIILYSSVWLPKKWHFAILLNSTFCKLEPWNRRSNLPFSLVLFFFLFSNFFKFFQIQNKKELIITLNYIVLGIYRSPSPLLVWGGVVRKENKMEWWSWSKVQRTTSDWPHEAGGLAANKWLTAHGFIVIE